MKELLGQAVNVYLAPDSEGVKLISMAEVILIVCEPTYTFDATGAMVKHRNAETFRFQTSPVGLRTLAKTFVKLAMDLDEMEADAKEGAKQPPASGGAP